MAGRTPKPSHLKLVEGNRGKRSTNKQEPDPEYVSDLSAPGWLPEAAKVVWDEVAPHLSKAKLLTEVDVQALAMGCVSIAQYRLAAIKASDNLVKAKVVDGPDGKPVETGEHINPWMFVQSMSFKQAMAIFQQFGMSPAARTRIAVQPQGDLFGDGNKDKTSGYFS